MSFFVFSYLRAEHEASRFLYLALFSVVGSLANAKPPNMEDQALILVCLLTVDLFGLVGSFSAQLLGLF